MTDNKYHGVTCPTCRKQVVIRLRQDEPYTGRCQCPHRTVTVVWAGRQADVTGTGGEMIATLALWWALQCPPTQCIVSPDPPMTVPLIYLPFVAG